MRKNILKYGTQMHVVHEVSCDSSDSDVIILPSEDSQHPTASLPRSRSPIAGPSRDLARGSGSMEAERSDSDGCVFVGYVKPLHERTPEIISLPSSDQEVDVKESSQMDTGLYDSRDSYVYSVSSSFEESSGSEYDPRTVQKSQKKKVNRKSKCDGTGKCKAKTSCKGGSKTTSTKKRVKTKPEKPQKLLTKKGQSHRQDELDKEKEEDRKLIDQFIARTTSSSSYLHHKGGSQKKKKCSSKSSSRQKHINK